MTSCSEVTNQAQVIGIQGRRVAQGILPAEVGEVVGLPREELLDRAQASADQLAQGSERKAEVAQEWVEPDKSFEGHCCRKCFWKHRTGGLK